MQSRILLVLTILVLACNSKKQTEEDDDSFSYSRFSESFKEASLPYVLSDTALQNNKDTVTLKGKAFSSLIPDSVTKKIFGKGAKVKYVPLRKIEVPKAERYFVVKATSGRARAALLLTFNEKDEFGAVFPLLVPDKDPATFQVSSIDKAYSISRAVTLRKANSVAAEGKDVYVYNKDARDFTLIMTYLLDEKSVDLVYPIDTLSKHHKLAGDYVKNKRNIVSVRDGRRPNLLTVFVHIENDQDCSGEIKGDAEITSPTTAVYRQPGDPCVLQLNFSSSSVKLTELEGCGSRRGLGCSFEGSFPKKKPSKSKNVKSKKDGSKK